MMKSPGPTYRFGAAVFCPSNLEVSVCGQVRSMEPKAYRTLAFLVENPGRVVSKEELMRTVWADIAVTDNALARTIAQIRRALDDDPKEPRYIVTVPTVGYRFIAEVSTIEDASLVKSPAFREADRTEKAPVSRAWANAFWAQGNWMAATLLVLGVTAGGWLIAAHRGKPALTEKDAIVLADFINSTGDAVFDGTLREGLALQLEKSPYLKIVDDEVVQRDLRLMSVPAGARITNQIAHDLCVREGGAATIDGAIASLGKDYVLTLQAIACQDGRTIVREQVQAEDKEHVLSALGTASNAMRSKLGESLSSVQRSNPPLEQATTPSLEALQNYNTGLSVMSAGQFLRAVPSFERAIAIDPKFTMAYYMLGIAHEQVGDLPKSTEYAREAFSMVDDVSETERAEITAYYYRATGELNKEIDAYELAVRNNYPRQWGFHTQLSLIFIDQGRFEEGLKEGLEAARLQGNVEPPYRRLLDAYICLGRLGEARDLADRVRRLGLDGPRIHQRFLEMAYLEDDAPGALREIQWFGGKPAEYLSFGLQAADRNVHGQRREAHKLYQRAADAASHAGAEYVATEFLEADALAEALSGKCETTRRLGRPALALALCGNAAEAEKLAAENSKQLPKGTIWNAVQLPEIHAAIALNNGRTAESVDLLSSASPYERSYLDAIYVRGLAYLRQRKGAEAAAEFQKIVNHKGASWGATWVHPNWGLFYSLSYLGAARGYVLAGDTASAKNAFQGFFKSWENADPDVPVLRRAKAEYAGLK